MAVDPSIFPEAFPAPQLSPAGDSTEAPPPQKALEPPIGPRQALLDGLKVVLNIVLDSGEVPVASDLSK